MKLVAILLIGIVVLNLWYQSQLRVKITKITTKDELIENIGPTPFEPHLKKVNLISFWATWCTSCKTEFPEIQKLHQKWKDKGFEVISVNCDQEEDSTKATEMYKGYGLKFPLFFDPENIFVEKFELEVLPSHLLVDAQGNILLKMEGATQWQSSKIQSLIQEHF